MRCSVPSASEYQKHIFFCGTQETPPACYLRLETRTFTKRFKLHDIALSGLVTVLSNLQVHPWIWFYSVGSYPAVSCRHNQSLLSGSDSTFAVRFKWCAITAHSDKTRWTAAPAPGVYVTSWPLHQVSGRQNLNTSVKGNAVRVNNLTVEMHDCNK